MYEPTVAEDPEEDKHQNPNPCLAVLQQPTPKPPVLPSPSKAKEPSESSTGWDLVRPTSTGRRGAEREVVPPAKVESSDSAV